MPSPILIIGAVPGELAGLTERLERPVTTEIGKRQMIAGYLDSVPVHLLATGPGLVNAVQALTAAVEHGRPRFIIQTGCAGAFRASGLAIGDIGIATKEIDVHLGLESGAGEGLPGELPFPVMHCGGRHFTSQYPIDPRRTDAATEVLSRAFGGQRISVQKGPFVTVSTITATDRRAKALYEKYQPCMEAMEGSGAAHVALHYDIPFLEIRAASNFVGKRERKTWNLPLAFERCCAAVREVAREIGTHFF